MRVVIMGSGRVGAEVANTLAEDNEVTVIDRNSHAFDRLGPRFMGRTIVGNGIDVDVLKAAGTAGADLFLAMTEEDDRNLMAGQIARQLGARRAIVRVYDPVRAETYSQMGLTTFSPTILGAQRLFEMVVNHREEE